MGTIPTQMTALLLISLHLQVQKLRDADGGAPWKMGLLSVGTFSLERGPGKGWGYGTGKLGSSLCVTSKSALPLVLLAFGTPQPLSCVSEMKGYREVNGVRWMGKSQI